MKEAIRQGYGGSGLELKDLYKTGMLDAERMSHSDYRNLLSYEIGLLEVDPGHSMEIINFCSEHLQECCFIPVNNKSILKNILRKGGKRGPAHIRWKQTAAAFSAVITLLLSLQLAGAVSGFHFFSFVTEWGREQFSMNVTGRESSGQHGTSPVQYRSLEGIPSKFTPYIPATLPQGFIFLQAAEESRGAETLFTLVYSSEQEVLRITASVYTDSQYIADKIQEKNQGAKEIWNWNGKDYYLSENEGRWFCSWEDSGTILTVSSGMEENELKEYIIQNYGGRLDDEKVD